MKKNSIIIILLMLFILVPIRVKNNDIKREIIIEDKDLQFVTAWIDLNIDSKTSLKSAYFGKLLDAERLLLILKKCRMYNIPPSIVLSQMFIESKHASKLDLADFVKQSNNYFGIKYGKFTDIETRKHRMTTTEQRNGSKYVAKQSFSSFKSFEDCLKAYFIIVTKDRADKTEKQWLRSMVQRYATSNSYLQLIHDVKHSNDFRSIDLHIKTHDERVIRLK